MSAIDDAPTVSPDKTSIVAFADAKHGTVDIGILPVPGACKWELLDECGRTVLLREAIPGLDEILVFEKKSGVFLGNDLYSEFHDTSLRGWCEEWPAKIADEKDLAAETLFSGPPQLSRTPLYVKMTAPLPLN